MLSREIVEGEQLQGKDEEITYSITTTPWGSSPSLIAVKVYDASNAYTDVTSTVMPVGAGSAVGDVITLPELKALTIGHIYRVEVKFDSGGNRFEPYLWVRCER